MNICLFVCLKRFYFLHFQSFFLVTITQVTHCNSNKVQTKSIWTILHTNYRLDNIIHNIRDRNLHDLNYNQNTGNFQRTKLQFVLIKGKSQKEKSMQNKCVTIYMTCNANNLHYIGKHSFMQKVAVISKAWLNGRPVEVFVNTCNVYKNW